MNIAICDDDSFQVEHINELLVKQKKKYSDINIYPFFTAKSLLESIERFESYDLVFLDIEMPEINGVELAKKVQNMLPNVLIFFISSHAEYISDAFYISAAQFIVKPLDEAKFEKEFARVYEKYCILHMAIVVPAGIGGGRKYFPVRDIVCIESNKRRLVFHTIDDELSCYGSFRLPQFSNLPQCFLRVQQGFIVNMYHVHTIATMELVCTKGLRVPISRSKSAEVKGRIVRFKGGGIL